MAKYIFVTGGVISGLGKGVISASIGSILQMLEQKKITIKKLDPYLNIDPGTMNPTEHGEVFVTEDGTETDLDLGYYERFLEIKTSQINSTSSGKLFQKILNNEREGKYLGKTVQMIPHFTNIIKDFICYNPNNCDYIICEIGGCVGDIEAMAFYEALRQLRNDLGIENILSIHLTYLVHYSITDELKTKPTQNNIRELQQVGITPDILICRSEKSISKEIKKKLSLHTNLPESNIIEAINLSSIYKVPLNLIKENIHTILSKQFNIHNKLNTEKWNTLNNKIENCNKTITIGLLGKYNELNDSYKSLLEAISHAGIYHNYNINIHWINARDHNLNYTKTLNNVHGIIIPGGFGNSGIENMISGIEYIRNMKIPILGICLGMQLMIIEYFKNVIGIKDATSEEFDKDGTNVITKINTNDNNIGGTMRLGLKEINLDFSLKNIYNKDKTLERHRHRYAINDNFKNILYENNCLVSGLSEEGIIEIIELKNHPWYIGCQYHPEYNSSPFNPHPLFLSFIENCI
tara:strand:- start:667 stop:2229 length:1563 start_codon:yes stop_codon:yes gene_type:complete